MKELRETVRFTCAQAVVCQVGRRKIQAEILDVSRGGARLALSAPLRVGQTVILKPEKRGRAPVEAVVRWQIEGERIEAGLEFQESPGKLARNWVRKLFPEQGKAWTEGKQKRSEVRTECRLPVVSLDGVWEGQTLDLSSSGACFVKQGKLKSAAQVYLCLPWDYVQVEATPIRATRREDGWVHSVRFGELNPQEKEHLKLFVEQSVNRTD